MKQDIEILLRDCRDKLEVYYQQTNGKENQSLINRINRALLIESHLSAIPFTLTVGDFYRHHKGGVYIIVAVANLNSDDDVKFPTTVVYRDQENRIWSRPARQFFVKFRPYYPHVPTAESQLQVVHAVYKYLWENMNGDEMGHLCEAIDQSFPGCNEVIDE